MSYNKTLLNKVKEQMNKPKPKPGSVKPKNGFIDLQKSLGIDPMSRVGIDKARELSKLYPNVKFVCDERGCAAIAGKAAKAYGNNFGMYNAWDFGNNTDVEYTNPAYAGMIDGTQGVLPNPTGYDVPQEMMNAEGRMIGLNRVNNAMSNSGRRVSTSDKKNYLAGNKKDANDSFDYANPAFYPNSRGYEHIGYALGNGQLLHGTAAASSHPAFYVIDNMKNGIDLSGYGRYQPVEMMDKPSMMQSAMTSAKKLLGFADGGSFGSAFAAARKQGLKTFEWNGKMYGTNIAGESTTAPRKTAAAPTPKPVVQQQQKSMIPMPMMAPRGTDTLGMIGSNNAARIMAQASQAKLPTPVYTEKDVAQLKKKGYNGDMKKVAQQANQYNQVAKDYESMETNPVVDAFRSVSPLPHNLDQNLLWFANRKGGFSDNRMTDKNLSEKEKFMLYAASQRAMKKNNEPYHGGMTYSNYGEDIREQAVEGKGSFFDKVTRGFTDDNFEMSHTFGGANYWNDPSSDYMYVTDSYDMNGKDGKKQALFNQPKGVYQNYRNFLADQENYTPTEQQMAERKAMIRLNKKEMEGLRKKYPDVQFKDGGLLSRTVSCSNCGHSWKSTEGGADPLSCHKCGGMVKMEGGGYVVTRSDDRKGKTHKVTGPDGTVKYFGDSKLGQHPSDPDRKAAFYARHKSNLEGNPFFRAFARKTWAEGGQTRDEREMVNGIADILSQVNDQQNRAQIARQMVQDFNNEDVTYDYDNFMKMSKLAAGGMIKRADGSYSRRGMWDNIRANKGSGKKPTKEMLAQERKIRAQEMAYGGVHMMPDGMMMYDSEHYGNGGSTFSGNAWYEMGGQPCYECGGQLPKAQYGMECPEGQSRDTNGNCVPSMQMKPAESNSYTWANMSEPQSIPLPKTTVVNTDGTKTTKGNFGPETVLYATDQNQQTSESKPTKKKSFLEKVGGNMMNQFTSPFSALNISNYAAGVSNFFDQQSKKKDEKEKMWQNNMADSLMPTNPTAGNRGDYVDSGTMHGMFRPDDMGFQSGNGQFGKKFYNQQFAEGGIADIIDVQGMNPIQSMAEMMPMSTMPEMPQMMEYNMAPAAPETVAPTPVDAAPVDNPVVKKGVSAIKSSLKDFIAQKESGGDYMALPRKKDGTLASSAVGKYQFLWKKHSNWISDVTGINSKEAFMRNPEAQEKAFDYWDKNTLTPWAQRIQRELGVKGSLKDIKAKIHFAGGQGAYNYFKSGKETVDGFGTKTSSYRDGGVYEVDASELQAIMAAGGEVEFIN